MRRIHSFAAGAFVTGGCQLLVLDKTQIEVIEKQEVTGRQFKVIVPKSAFFQVFGVDAVTFDRKTSVDQVDGFSAVVVIEEFHGCFGKRHVMNKLSGSSRLMPFPVKGVKGGFVFKILSVVDTSRETKKQTQ
jgi:hypothetical protein